jgi:hypothetical protein
LSDQDILIAGSETLISSYPALRIMGRGEGTVKGLPSHQRADGIEITWALNCACTVHNLKLRGWITPNLMTA